MFVVDLGERFEDNGSGAPGIIHQAKLLFGADTALPGLDHALIDHVLKRLDVIEQVFDKGIFFLISGYNGYGLKSHGT